MPIAAMYAHDLPITLFIAYHPWPFRHALTVPSTIAAAGGSGADRIVGAIRPGVRYCDVAYAAMT